MSKMLRHLLLFECCFVCGEKTPKMPTSKPDGRPSRDEVYLRYLNDIVSCDTLTFPYHPCTMGTHVSFRGYNL